MRGIRIGETSHPGPPGVMHLYGDEDGDIDVLLDDSIVMATQVVHFLEVRDAIEDDTEPPTPFGPTPLTPRQPADVEFASPGDDISAGGVWPGLVGPDEEEVVDTNDATDVVELPGVGEEPGIFDVPGNSEVPRVRCPWCTFSSGTSGGMVRHISCRHEGSMIDDTSCSFLVGLGKGCCLSCGALRSLAGHFFSRCRTSIGTRPPISGDLIRAPRIDRESIPINHSPNDPGIWVPSLPENLLERLRKIPSNTIVHVPIAFEIGYPGF